MLRRLEISDYALIAHAEVDFAEGATIFTGETGSGKTMILGALGCVLGARASADAVRRGAARARVTLTFEPDAALRARLRDDGFELDADEDATIAREISESGKSSVRVNGRPATAAYVREIGEGIAEIVGQHEAQRLLAPTYHLELLDRFGGGDAALAREAVVAAHQRASECARELAALHGDERQALRRYEDARFALREIEDAAPEEGEDERLGERRRYLDNVERIASALRSASESLAGDDGGASSSLGAASVALDGIAEIGTTLREMASQAAALQSEANELAARIARELDATEDDPAELDAINARLDALDRLKRKYGASLREVLAFAESAREIVARYESRDALVAQAHATLAQAESELTRVAATLTAIRVKAAKALAKAVVSELKDLALDSARFDVAFTPHERIAPDGAEAAEFTFAANAGEALRPLARVASGGELSRVLLALVVALAAQRERTALVFDEIDAGIGGATATAVGARLGRLARSGQVLCVTHLAQLATWADAHYVLEKHERGGATTIGVRAIAGDDARAAELARMLSGQAHDAALEHARALLRQAAAAR
ncbi:MAG: DNA repair protein RecN [bacterium]|nr:DNA repair protein RecN [bacterium]